PDAIIASNTSALSITTIANEIPSPERVAGIHFFNPVDRMPLVEIVRGEKSSGKTLVISAALVNKLGKYPIIVGDVPGFLVNLILTTYLNEAIHVVSEGVSAEVIEQAALRFGMPMGPLRLLDEVGLDVANHVGTTMEAGYGARFARPDLVSKLLSRNRK